MSVIIKNPTSYPYKLSVEEVIMNIDANWPYTNYLQSIYGDREIIFRKRLSNTLLAIMEFSPNLTWSEIKLKWNIIKQLFDITDVHMCTKAR
eukprot:Pgem_evm1s16169